MAVISLSIFILIQLDRLDDDCVEEIAHYKQISKEETREQIMKVLSVHCKIFALVHIICVAIVELWWDNCNIPSTSSTEAPRKRSYDFITSSVCGKKILCWVCVSRINCKKSIFHCAHNDERGKPWTLIITHPQHVPCLSSVEHQLSAVPERGQLIKQLEQFVLPIFGHVLHIDLFICRKTTVPPTGIMSPSPLTIGFGISNVSEYPYIGMSLPYIETLLHTGKYNNKNWWHYPN